MPSSSSVRRGLVAGAAVLVLACTAVGVAAAQATPSPTPNGQAPAGYQAFLSALAKRLNISTDALQQAISGARTDVGLPANGPGFGPGGPGGPGGRGGHGPGGPRGADLNTAAQAIGISVDQLRQELPGKSLAQVAQAHGKNPTDVATALKNAANQRIDQEVAAGHLTADEGNQRKTAIDQRIDQQLNQVVPQGGPGPRGAAPKATPTAAAGA